MTLNGAMALILRYFTELGSLQGLLCKSGWRYSRKLPRTSALSRAPARYAATHSLTTHWHTYVVVSSIDRWRHCVTWNLS